MNKTDLYFFLTWLPKSRVKIFTESETPYYHGSLNELKHPNRTEPSDYQADYTTCALSVHGFRRITQGYTRRQKTPVCKIWSTRPIYICLHLVPATKMVVAQATAKPAFSENVYQRNDLVESLRSMLGSPWAVDRHASGIKRTTSAVTEFLRLSCPFER